MLGKFLLVFCLFFYLFKRDFVARRNEEITYGDLILLSYQMRCFHKDLTNGIIDSCQHFMRKDLKAIRSFSLFTRVYLPKNMAI
jgi:hypothetical protein